MAFSIVVNGQEFSLEDFLTGSFEASYILRAQVFLRNWKYNENFCFSSSGTTGLPKQIYFTKQQLIKSAQSTIDALQLNPQNEHILACLDVKFVGGAMMLARALVLECKISLFEPSSEILSFLPENHGYTFASFVPIQLQNLNTFRLVFEQIDKVLLGGANVTVLLKQALYKLHNKVYHTYGMTETLSHVALMQLGVDKGYMAIAPNTIRLNENNQICIKTALHEQEIISNDVGRWLDDSHFEWLGRTDFMINSGGVKIHPEAIESLLLNERILPADITFYIAKAPHPIWQEQVVMVSTDANAAQYLQQINNFLQTIGQAYAKPRRFVHVKTIPTNENGKIMRLTLNEIIENERL